MTDRAQLAELADKYKTLARLRRDKLDGHPTPDRAVFRRLAQRFPGTLNELDTLPLAEIDARAEQLERAAAGGEIAAWMLWMWTFHALMRAALFAKRRRSSGEDPADVAREASTYAGVEVDATFARAVVEPDRDRIVAFVFGEVGARFGEDGERIWTALFPRRRGARRRPG